jgi:hypothetical protein
MTAAVASRVVVEIYRGIDFPGGWADREQPLDIGMARDLVVSVAAMFDAGSRPVALCWQIDGRAEKFIHARPQDGGDTSLLDELNSDLTPESLRFGASDLLATLMWAPDKLRADQGEWAHRIVFGRGQYYYITGWDIAPRTLVAKAGNLLVMTRRIDDGLALPMPTCAEDMHRHMGTSDPRVLMVLPGKSAMDAPEKNIGLKMALLFGGLLVTGTLICAYLLNAG